jgi:hypothetical protein
VLSLPDAGVITARHMAGARNPANVLLSIVFPYAKEGSRIQGVEGSRGSKAAYRFKDSFFSVSSNQNDVCGKIEGMGGNKKHPP